MDIGIKFPSTVDVVTDEVRRFRALSPIDRVKALDEMFRLYHFLAATSGRQEEIIRLGLEEEERGRKSIEDFVARHS
jgi:hypothetical protein